MSNSREQIDVLWTELIAENVVKGWGRASGQPPMSVTSREAPIPAAPATAKKRGKATAATETPPEAAAEVEATETAVAKPAPKKRAPAKKKTAE